MLSCSGERKSVLRRGSGKQAGRSCPERPARRPDETVPEAAAMDEADDESEPSVENIKAGSSSVIDLWDWCDSGLMPKKKGAQDAKLEHFIIWNTTYYLNF